jgi:hypothetical protein
MRKHFVMAAVIATIPIAAAYADPTGAGSGLPGGWSAGNAGMAKPMRPPLKATKQDVNVTTSNATTSASTSSATAPSKAIHVKTKDGMKIQTNLK